METAHTTLSCGVCQYQRRCPFPHRSPKTQCHRNAGPLPRRATLPYTEPLCVRLECTQQLILKVWELSPQPLSLTPSSSKSKIPNKISQSTERQVTNCILHSLQNICTHGQRPSTLFPQIINQMTLTDRQAVPLLLPGRGH